MTPADHVIVLFGATGDLARRKLLPGLFRLDQAGLMPDRYRIVGTSRAPLDRDGFRRFAREAVHEFGGVSANGEWDAFARKLSYDDSFAAEHELEAYERLIHDALMGDRTLFTRADGIERLWEVSAPVPEVRPRVRPYAPGSWGPQGIDELIAPDRWHLPEPA